MIFNQNFRFLKRFLFKSRRVEIYVELKYNEIVYRRKISSAWKSFFIFLILYELNKLGNWIFLKLKSPHPNMPP